MLFRSVFKVGESYDDETYRIAASRYDELYPEKKVPSDFIIKNNDPSFPENTWGMNLGLYTRKMETKIRIRRLYPKFRLVESALLLFKKHTGTLVIPKDFIISDVDVWPKEMIGLELGVIADRIQKGLSYRDYTEELSNIGLISKCGGWESFRLALLNYEVLHGDMFVPDLYTVPSDSVAWPEESWGMDLGNIASQVRRGKWFKERREELIELGFCLNRHVSILLWYKKLYGDLLVPFRYVVPSLATWPKEYWDMKLGRAVNEMRSKKISERERQQLEDMGFVFKVRKSYDYETFRVAVF